MKALLICPAERDGVALLATRQPLAMVSILGRTPLEYWLETLAARGAKHVFILASDRPNVVRQHVGDGRRWGLQAEVIPCAQEPTEEQARHKYRRGADADWLPEADCTVVDHLPGQPDLRLFETYAGFFAALRSWMPHARTAARVGVREISPGVWVGLHAEIDPSAQLIAPCWLGDYVRLGAKTTIGPGAAIDDRCVVEVGGRVKESAVMADTLVGKHISVEHSLAHGSELIHWRLNSVLEVPDPFLLADLRTPARQPFRTTLVGRGLALIAMIVSLPFAIGVMLLSVVRSYPPWLLRLGLRSQPPGRPAPHDTFAYYELTGAKNWLRRWPQLWNIFRGSMAWFGNRPLRPTQALVLANDFERLWLAAPVGLISLADAHGCPDGVSDEAVAHASYYAVHRGARLNAFILSRTVLRAALVWPIRGHRRPATVVPLQTLVPKQEL